MPAHRLKKAADTQTVKNGASPSTVGIAFDTTGAVSTRTSMPASPKFSSDGSTVYNMLDGLWATKALTDAATSLFSVPVAALATVGGTMQYLVEASDGVDTQCMSGIVSYAAVGKTTVVVGTFTELATTGAKAISAGGSTLTLSFTADVSVANVVTYKCTPTGSLTETTYRITFWLSPVRGVITLL